MAVRSIIVHNHIFKNAGTTLDWSLARSFGKSYVDHRDDEQMRRGADYLGPWLQTNSHVKALSSHHIRYPLPEHSNQYIVPILLIRDPIDRIGSVYTFERQQRTNTPGAVHAKKFSFSEYVDWRMRPDVPGVIRNGQIRSIGPNKKRPVFAENDLSLALDHLQRLHVFGIVELYDESMVLMEVALRPHFPEIDLAYLPQNTSSRHRQSLQEKKANIERELGEERMNTVLQQNHWDLRLYECARNFLQQSIDQMDHFDDRLQEFKARCAQLNQGS